METYEKQRQDLANALYNHTQQVIHGPAPLTRTQRVKLFVVKKLIQCTIFVCRLLGVK